MSGKKDTRKWSEVMAFDDLRESGLLWLINTTVFHPRGMALTLQYDGPELIGWRLFKDDEVWVFPDEDANESFAAFNTFLANEFGSAGVVTLKETNE